MGSVALWRTGNVDFITSKVESRYVSRINTKALLGYFGYVKDILNDFRVPKVIFVTIRSFCRLVSQGRMAVRWGICWTIRHGGPKIRIFQLKK